MRDRINTMKNLSVKQKKVARLVQKDIAVQEFPFRKIASLCGLTEESVLEITGQLLKKRFDPEIRSCASPSESGIQKERTGGLVCSRQKNGRSRKYIRVISLRFHCYERKPAFMNKYNIFTMLHSGNKNISSLINEMVNAAKIKNYLILDSVKEYKKTSPEYF